MITEKDGRLPLLFALIAMIVVPILALVPGAPINRLLIPSERDAGIEIIPRCAGKPVRSCGKAAGEVANVRSSSEWREDNSNWVGDLRGDEMIPILGTETGKPVYGSNDAWYIVCWPGENGEWVEAYAYSTTLNEESDISRCTDTLVTDR